MLPPAPEPDPPPAINLLKGSGPIKGMGEKDAANLLKGTGSMTLRSPRVRVATVPGRN